MENEKRKFSVILKRLLIAALVLFVLFIGVFVLYAFLAKGAGDPDLADFAGVMKSHLNGMLHLFTFDYADNARSIYFGLSVFVYAFIVCWVIFLVAGLVINGLRKRKLMWLGIILTLLNILTYLVLASGSDKFLNIFANQEAGKEVIAMIIVLLALAGLYGILTLFIYLWCVVETYMDSKVDEQEELGVSEEFIRKIVKDELVENQPFKVVVVGGEFKMEPLPKEEPKEEEEEVPLAEVQPNDEIVVHDNIVPEEEKVPEYVIVPEEKEEEPEPEPEPEFEEEQEQVEEGAENEDYGGFKRGAREAFIQRMLRADLDTKANYNELKNEILAYGVKSRLSRTGDVFRLHTKKYVKIFLVGKTLKVYLALNPEDYKDTTFPIEDVGYRPNYAEIPLLFKVRSGLSVRRCKELIKDAMEKDGLAKKEVENVNWVNELRKQIADKAKDK